MNHPLLDYLLEQHPHGIVLLTTFCEKHPELLPLRRGRAVIDRLDDEPPDIQSVFIKVFGRWHVNIPRFAKHMVPEQPSANSAA